MDLVRWMRPLSGRHSVLVAAFAGWNDAGDAASSAIKHLIEQWDAEKVAEIDPEELFDFHASRPQVQIADDGRREIVWPANELFSASTEVGDVLLLSGTEPQLRWRAFCEAVTDVTRQAQSDLGVLLGALLADVAHSRPVPVIGTTSEHRLMQRFGLRRSTYEGPTGIVGVLHDALERRGLPTASLWATVPAYAPGAPSPKATAALVEGVSRLVGVPVDVSSFDEAVRDYEEEVSSLVSDDEDLAGYVRRLEAIADGEQDEDDDELPTDAQAAERMLEDIERYLRDQGKDR